MNNKFKKVLPSSKTNKSTFHTDPSADEEVIQKTTGLRYFKSHTGKRKITHLRTE